MAMAPAREAMSFSPLTAITGCDDHAMHLTAGGKILKEGELSILAILQYSGVNKVLISLPFWQGIQDTQISPPGYLARVLSILPGSVGRTGLRGW
jgi:hypothetical protein